MTKIAELSREQGQPLKTAMREILNDRRPVTGGRLLRADGASLMPLGCWLRGSATTAPKGLTRSPRAFASCEAGSRTTRGTKPNASTGV
jgi:hypothetical protein